MVAGTLAVASAAIGIWVYVKERRSAKAARDLEDADDFIADITKPSPAETAWAALRRHNQRRYWKNRSSPSAAVYLAVSLLVLVIALLLFSILPGR
jgi:plasmid stabilization system protein ParE